MVRGLCPAIPIRYRLPVASAQVKSAILLAGLNTPGITVVEEPVPTRDHSETMLRGFGADLTVETDAHGLRTISIRGECDLQPQHVVVPGDPSSAAFLIVAALIVPGSDIRIENVGLNPTRDGLIRLMQAMGGDIVIHNPRTTGGESVGDLQVRHSVLRGIDIDPAIVPSMVDEFPVAFVAAAMAQGQSVFTGLEELRVKESDRIRTMAIGLAAIGAKVTETADGMIIDGTGGDPLPGLGDGDAAIATHLDHRIAMSFAVAGMASTAGVKVDDMAPVNTSFPGFADVMSNLKAHV
jgi:3-phosphoshikimate 1-carboxyvinyltransferase